MVVSWCIGDLIDHCRWDPGAGLFLLAGNKLACAPNLDAGLCHLVALFLFPPVSNPHCTIRSWRLSLGARFLLHRLCPEFSTTLTPESFPIAIAKLVP